ncbi:MAG: SpoIIE family protein phosphatase, partial [Nitrospinaceae bacterium]|nr:SpoIIE family protein phosphatase [Nitrospinaceae bacterium]NIR55127.1 SpoIIE family protein phosphatase [Nitrospinaceae bacterium]NIS85547.1 SpoIIE family protein phosphatase [Nitrospinaceae bacterium]NIT82381.1 SpoIIE family protein phosphatase [Nitrospinaceae bacterium]NIU44594.1 SpoIIE family protein phosphatase [Nitrospinaceae bacterium]
MNRLRHALQCSEIWGGNQEIDADVWTRSLHASVYSRSVEGGKGGDIYYFSLCANDRLTRLALADVTGHGKVVSDISQWIYEALSHQMNTRESSAVLQELNRRVKPSESTSEYNSVTTATVVTVNRMDSTIRFAYAGHPPMLVKRQGKKEWTEVGLKSPSHGGNIPLGVLE